MRCQGDCGGTTVGSSKCLDRSGQQHRGHITGAAPPSQMRHKTNFSPTTASLKQPLLCQLTALSWAPPHLQDVARSTLQLQRGSDVYGLHPHRATAVCSCQGRFPTRNPYRIATTCCCGVTDAYMSTTKTNLRFQRCLQAYTDSAPFWGPLGGAGPWPRRWTDGVPFYTGQYRTL